MSHPPEFRLIPVTSLVPHEQIDPDDVERLSAEIRRLGMVQEPIWVSRDGIILNGHHRYAALRKLGVHSVPAWVIDYPDPAMELHRWGPGAPPSKEEVVAHARAGGLFPPKTTRHIWRGPPPDPHPTMLAELQRDAPDNGSRPGPREPDRSEGPR